MWTHFKILGLIPVMTCTVNLLLLKYLCRADKGEKAVCSGHSSERISSIYNQYIKYKQFKTATLLYPAMMSSCGAQ